MHAFGSEYMLFKWNMDHKEGNNAKRKKKSLKTINLMVWAEANKRNHTVKMLPKPRGHVRPIDRGDRLWRKDHHEK